MMEFRNGRYGDIKPVDDAFTLELLEALTSNTKNPTDDVIAVHFGTKNELDEKVRRRNQSLCDQRRSR